MAQTKVFSLYLAKFLDTSKSFFPFLPRYAFSELRTRTRKVIMSRYY